MSQHSFSLITGIIFLLVAMAHLLRIVFGLPIVIEGVSIPLWVSVIALVIAGFLSYEGFHLGRKSLTKP
jgi:hypothetical protein